MNMSGTPQSSVHPVLVADSYGLVHLFWSEDYGGVELTEGEVAGPGNTIMYRRWDGETWTESIDIIAPVGESTSDHVDAAIGPDGTIHLIWLSSNRLYYANSPLSTAISPGSWSRPQVLANDAMPASYAASITVDPAGKAHVLYASAGTSPAVYHISKGVEDLDWSVPGIAGTRTSDVEVAMTNVRVRSDSEGRLFAAFQSFNSSSFGQAVYYTHSSDGGANWSPQERLAWLEPGGFEASWPAVGVAEDGRVALVNVAGLTVGRDHWVSADNDATLSGPERIWESMEGVNGFVYPLFDSSGREHIIGAMRTLEQQVGVYHSQWTGTGWSPVLPVDNTSPGAPSAHYATATVRLGNELHVAYTQLAEGEIWYSRAILDDVPSVAAQTLDLPDAIQPAPTRVGSSATEASSPTVVGASSRPAPSVTAQPSMAVAPAQQSAWSGLLPGIIAALVCVLAAVGYTLWRRGI
jgi:hypothetical protein